MVMLDYRACGPEGEPAVIDVDQELDCRVTFLASGLETFVRGLVNESVFDTSAEELESAVRAIERRRFSTALTDLLARSSPPGETEGVLRRLLGTIATQKGCFALHDDPRSYLVYDLLFSLFVGAHTVRTPEAFLEAYPDLLALGDGEVRTRGYAPGFVAAWMQARLARGEIVERDGTLALSDAHRDALEAQLVTFR